jgi:hypothetical protein
MKSLMDPPPIIHSVKVKKGTTKGLEMDIDLTIFNPSSISAKLGKVIFFLYSEKKKLGRVIIDDFVLVPGANQLTVTTNTLLPGKDMKLVRFISNYLSGKTAMTREIAMNVLYYFCRRGLGRRDERK